MIKDKRKEAEKQEKSRWLEKSLVDMLWLLLVHRNNGLLLSELGSYLLGPEAGCAGTKRISNLVHSERWGTEFIEVVKFHWCGEIDK